MGFVSRVAKNLTEHAGPMRVAISRERRARCGRHESRRHGLCARADVSPHRRFQAEMIPQLRRHTSTLIAALKNLVLSGYAPEHDVHGIVDPFLQVPPFAPCVGPVAEEPPGGGAG